MKSELNNPEALTMNTEQPTFSGNIYIFTAFDIGFDIDFKALKMAKDIKTEHVHVSKFFKHYHLPLEVELPELSENSRYVSSKVHPFGAISLSYKIPFTETLSDLRTNLLKIDEKYQRQSVNDAYNILNNGLSAFLGFCFYEFTINDLTGRINNPYIKLCPA